MVRSENYHTVFEKRWTSATTIIRLKCASESAGIAVPGWAANNLRTPAEHLFNSFGFDLTVGEPTVLWDPGTIIQSPI